VVAGDHPTLVSNTHFCPNFLPELEIWLGMGSLYGSMRPRKFFKNARKAPVQVIVLAQHTPSQGMAAIIARYAE
jgi:hypothetical protein